MCKFLGWFDLRYLLGTKIDMYSHRSGDMDKSNSHCYLYVLMRKVFIYKTTSWKCTISDSCWFNTLVEIFIWCKFSALKQKNKIIRFAV